MAVALGEIRGEPAPTVPPRAAWLGIAKYGLAALAASLAAAIAITAGVWPLALLAIPVFYAVEAPWAFAFPCAIDGDRDPLAASRAIARRAGGTVAVMRVVMPIAAHMLFGGILGRGFLRSWCVGCLAVVLYYDEVA